MRVLLIALLLAGCKKNAVEDDTGFDDTSDTGEVFEESPIGPLGWIGSPCEQDDDCDYDGGVCLDEGQGLPGGLCTLPCDRFCPDQDGDYPVTFCVDADDLPARATTSEDGTCVSRCDLGLFPDSGCRAGYGCEKVARVNEPETQTYACMPGADSDLTSCHITLAEAGVRFSPTIMADRSPSSHPGLTCHVDDPVLVHPPIHGVDVVYYDGTPTPNITMSCEGALSLGETAEDASEHGVATILHIGTYNCRVINGTSSLSRHAYGDAIDIYGFEMEAGPTYTLIDDWEHDTTTPTSAAAQFLYGTATRWYDDWVWNIILTPNFNAGHDNHFHVDLTPGSHSIREPIHLLIPAPYAD